MTKLLIDKAIKLTCAVGRLLFDLVSEEAIASNSSSRSEGHVIRKFIPPREPWMLIGTCCKSRYTQYENKARPHFAY